MKIIPYFKDYVAQLKQETAFIQFMANTNGMSSIEGLTSQALLIALVLMPIGIATLLNANKTTWGITAGSTEETIFDAFTVLILAVVVMGFLKKGKK